jgi:hypothetical protein
MEHQHSCGCCWWFAVAVDASLSSASASPPLHLPSGFHLRRAGGRAAKRARASGWPKCDQVLACGRPAGAQPAAGRQRRERQRRARVTPAGRLRAWTSGGVANTCRPKPTRRCWRPIRRGRPVSSRTSWASTASRTSSPRCLPPLPATTDRGGWSSPVVAWWPDLARQCTAVGASRQGHDILDSSEGTTTGFSQRVRGSGHVIQSSLVIAQGTASLAHYVGAVGGDVAPPSPLRCARGECKPRRPGEVREGRVGAGRRRRQWRMGRGALCAAR